ISLAPSNLIPKNPRPTTTAVSRKTTRGTLMGPSPITIARSNPTQNTLRRPTTAATSRLKGNDLEGAIAEYTRAIEINPNLAQAYYNRGVAKTDQGDSSGAARDLER